MSEVPSPASPAPQAPAEPEPELQTAEEFLAEVSAQDGRIFRMIQAPRVFIVTTNGALAGSLLRRGAKSFLPAHLVPQDLAPRGSYRRTAVGDVEEWDIEIAGMPGIEGSLWEAAGAYRNGVPR